jgi:hypothetical protein
MLDEIVVEFDRGEHEAAMHELRSLQRQWTQYTEGGANPELFQKEVAAIRMKTNAGPDGAANGSQPIRSETNGTSSAAPRR